MNYVILNAYLERNLGDDLFVKYLVQRYDNIKFYILDTTDKYIENSLNNLKIIDLENTKLIRKLSWFYPSLIPNLKNLVKKNSKANIYIGGSLFIEYDNWNEITNWWDYQANNYPFFVIGSNFGPYSSKDYKKRMNDIFSNCKDVCLRDQYSYNLFKENNNVRYAPDILLSYKMPKKRIRKQIFISTINCSKKDEGCNKINDCQSLYESFLLDVIKEYLSKDYHIVLSSFCEQEGDNITIENLIKSLNFPSNIEIINYDGFNSDDVLESISSSSYIIASRFHATILALAAKRPVLPVIYSDKTKNVLEDMQFKGNIIDIRNLKKHYTFDEISQNMYLVQDMDKYISKSEEHFLKLDEYLKK